MIEEYNNLVEKEDRLLLQNQSELLPIDFDSIKVINIRWIILCKNKGVLAKEGAVNENNTNIKYFFIW